MPPPEDSRPTTSPESAEQAAFVAEFLAGYESDLAKGETRGLSDYQALHPGREELVAAEWNRLHGEDPEEDAEEPLPERIAHYLVERELGRGGQGRVYLARDTKLDRLVAIKVLPDRGPFSTRQLQRFRREAEVAARLDHPGICTVFDSGRSDGVTYIAMRYVRGRTLAEQLGAEVRGHDYLVDRDELFRVVSLVERAARAVHAAHLAGIVHRDIKPGNLMVSDGGDPVVLDFGLAGDESVTGGAALTLTDEIFGTPVYMSPEQLREGGTKLDPRTDVYSLGATLYEALTLQMPFESSSRESLFQSILAQEPVPAGRLNRNLPKDLCTVLATAMAKERDRRYRTAHDFAEDLRRVREYLPIEASPVGPVARAARWCRRNRTVAALSLSLFLVMGITLTVTGLALGESQRARKNLEDSLADIRAGKASKREIRLRELLAQSWQKLYSADARKALPLLDEVFSIDATNTEAIVARTWADSDDPGEALATLDRLTGGVPPEEIDVELVWLRGYFLAADSRPDEADTEFARAGDRETALRLYFRGLQTVHGFREQISEADARKAIVLFRHAIARAARPKFHHHHSVLMTAAGIDDREVMDEATADLQFHWPDSPATYEAIAQFYMPVDRTRGLAALRWLTEHTREAAPYCGLAVDAMARGKPAEALSMYSKGIRIEPDFPAIWWMRGTLHVSLGNDSEARSDLRRAIELQPGFSMFHQSLFAFHEKRASWREARADFAAITKAHPRCWQGLKHLGQACERLEDSRAALEAYATADRIHPGDAELEARIEALK